MIESMHLVAVPIINIPRNSRVIP